MGTAESTLVDEDRILEAVAHPGCPIAQMLGADRLGVFQRRVGDDFGPPPLEEGKDDAWRVAATARLLVTEAAARVPASPLPPGDVFSVGYDPAEGRYILFRTQCTVAPGAGGFSVVGVTSKNIRDTARMAYEYLRASGKKIGMDRDLGQYDVNVQVMSLTAGKDAKDLGMALYIALLSAILGRPYRGPARRARPDAAPRRHGPRGRVARGV